MLQSKKLNNFSNNVVASCKYLKQISFQKNLLRKQNGVKSMLDH